MVEGTQIGAYRVLKQVGEGGMGSVWLAEHLAIGRRAAVKMLHPEFSNRPDVVARFFNEARASSAIADPGIVQIFDFGHHIDGRAYIVMEFLEGEPLDRRLKREGALGILDGMRLVRQVASTLSAAHSRGIVHRDLKPENIYIVPDPEVPGGERAKVLDFGIAKLTGDQVGIIPGPSSPTPRAPAPPSPEPPDPSIEVAPVMKDALARFVAWSREHPGAPCPDAAALGVHNDPWGNKPRVTCTDQPADQMAGVISAGPDGKLDTVDDVMSWQLGRDLTDLVRGPRWVIATPAQTVKSSAPSKSRNTGVRSSKRGDVRDKPTSAVPLDENGMPISR